MSMLEDHPHTQAFSVFELTQLARQMLERLPLFWVSGEISNLTRAASGHLYFTLKDAQAQVRCVLWRGKAQLLGFRPENGQNVEARALATLYEARGEFQLNVETLRLTGQGSLFERFMELRLRLETEGLFSAEHKRPLPAFPRSIALVTSPQAAAYKDVLATLARRAPHVAVELFPTSVQGANAPDEIVRALRAASASRCDIILLCRGGGSLEDLWSFNEERVARAIRATRLPVISGIGHETDFTIADFAADLRAPTPTAAAELACPDRRELALRLDALRKRLQRQQRTRLMNAAQRLDTLAVRLPSPARQMTAHLDRLTTLRNRMLHAEQRLLSARREEVARLIVSLNLRVPPVSAAMEHLARLSDCLVRARRAAHDGFRNRLEQAAQSLRQLNPLAVLQRGYALALDAEGRVARDPQRLQAGEILRLKLAKGEVRVMVQKEETP